MKKKKKDNVVKFNNVTRINVAVVIFAAIILYVAISIIISIKKQPLTLYKVGESRTDNNINCTGIAIRNEVTVKTNKSGHLAYFSRDNEKVRKQSAVCAIDESGNFLNFFDDENAVNIELTKSDYQKIRDTISLYKNNYNDVDFYNVYNFKNEVDNRVLDVANQMLLDRMSVDKKQASALSSIYAPISGILCFYTDGYEDKKVDTLTKEDFDKSNYVKTSFSTGDIINSGATVFKMIEDENWDIVCRISKEDAEKLDPDEKIDIVINNSNFDIYVPFTLKEDGDECILDISLKKYMSTFANERFLSIEIIMDNFEGLKIPNTSLVQKDVYLLPIEFATKGGNDSRLNKVYKKAVKEDGTETIEQIKMEIYKKDDKYLWVNPDSFKNTDVLVQMNTNNILDVSLLKSDKIYGVYQANEGVADFIEVDIVREGDEFTIVSGGGSLRKYDNIVMDSAMVKENQTIY
ncbi:MAG: hypothetical protein K6C35_10250 [Eubacterium sp.]|nr:hypothetical protein [Eubacterium sp.]